MPNQHTPFASDRILSKTHPALAAQWHPTKNQKSVDLLTAGSNAFAWWICNTCGHEWKAKISNRTILGRGCPPCGVKRRTAIKRLSIQEFINNAKRIHGELYDYSRVDYRGTKYKVIIGCAVHGFFRQKAGHHMDGFGCPQCSYDRSRGSSSPVWKGCGELSGSYWAQVQANAKRRSLEVSIDIEYAWNLFLLQDRRCVLSGRTLIIESWPNQTASLDRIDSTRGYVVGNVQWIHKDLQAMKMNFAQEEFVKICEEIVRYYRRSDFCAVS
jgi:hypothetical protein